MTDNEMLDAIKTLLKPINNKLEDLDLKLESLRLENKIEHRAIRGDIEHLNDEMETVIEALRAKNILPMAK
ncbi:hypothetical protein D7X87_26350 [bacterium D16-54]|nr:hypothetical protein D7X87_26350 [bacterium D16-54]RKJ08687.1 hypothetical protein D7X65_26340 [bacterium D16-56]